MFKKAKAIWHKNVMQNQYLSFSQIFYCDSTVGCNISIRCHSNYVLYINGKYIASGQYPDYDFYKVFDTIEIDSAILKEGENLISILAYCQFENSSTYKKGTPSLIFELYNNNKVFAASGSDTFVRQDRSYESGDIEKITTQLGYSFHYDARQYDGWIDDINAQGFEKAVIIETDNKYFKRPIKKLSIENGCKSSIIAAGEFVQKDMSINSAKRIYTALMRPINMQVTPLEGNIIDFKSDTDGIYLIVDLFKERAGYLSFDLSVDSDCLIDIGYGEHLTDLRVRSVIAGRNFACSYYAKAGRNKFTHYITRFAGRYIQMHVYNKQVSVSYVGLKCANYPLTEINKPSGLDRLEEKIYQTSIDTLRLCMHEHYEDCPWREQALYTMDSHNQMLAGYYAFKEFDFAKASIRMLGYGMREDGFLELCAPAAGVPPIPSFTAIWIINLYEYTLYSKDYSFANECLPIAQKIIETFDSLIENNIVKCPQGKQYWNFYDWVEGLDGYGKTIIADDCILNIFYAYALNSYIKLLDILNIDSFECKAKYNSIKNAINDHYFDSDFKGYVFNNNIKIYCELAQAISILSGVCPDKYINDILDGIEAGKYKPFTTFSYKIFKYDALLTQPQRKKYVRDEISTIWSKMLFEGATSFWETEKGQADFHNAGSLCHGWSAIPAYFYFKL